MESNSTNSIELTPLMTADKVARYLGVKTKTIHQFVREGRLSCVQVTARDRRFTPEQIEAFIASRTIAVPKRIDNSAPQSLPSPRKGGAKSSGFNRAQLRKELREC
jgi:excisionase family DNA binding protein